jgi:hypothetical protein
LSVSITHELVGRPSNHKTANYIDDGPNFLSSRTSELNNSTEQPKEGKKPLSATKPFSTTILQL